MQWKPRLAIVVVAIAGALILGGARAEVAADMGRLIDVEGPVSIRPAGAAQWMQGMVNAPIGAGDAVATAPDARAGLRIGPLAVYLDGASVIDVMQVGGAITLHVGAGAAFVDVPALPYDGVWIADDYGAVRSLQPGRYHLERNSIADASMPVTPFDAWALARLSGALGWETAPVQTGLPLYVAPVAIGQWYVMPGGSPVWLRRPAPERWTLYERHYRSSDRHAVRPPERHGQPSARMAHPEPAPARFTSAPAQSQPARQAVLPTVRATAVERVKGPAHADRPPQIMRPQPRQHESRVNLPSRVPQAAPTTQLPAVAPVLPAKHDHAARPSTASATAVRAAERVAQPQPTTAAMPGRLSDRRQKF